MEARDALRSTIFPSLAPYVSVILTMLTTASISVTIEPVIWAGLGEGGPISEALFWDGSLSHTLVS